VAEVDLDPPRERGSWGPAIKCLAPFLGLALIIAIFAVLTRIQGTKGFVSLGNFRTVLVQTVSVGIAALGMTAVIISAGIDLSVGSVMALTSVVTALCLREGWHPMWALTAGVAGGGVCGFANGAMVTGLRIVPFIATLGMLGIARGAAKYLAGQQTIIAPPGWLGTEMLARFPTPRWIFLSPGVWVMLLLAAAMAWMLRNTALGRNIFAIGSNEAAARLCGIRVTRTKITIYTLAGLFAGLAGVMQFCRITVGDPTTAVGAELEVIAAVVIGGGSLAGGEGSILGTVIGALIMAFLRNGCNMTGVPNYVQEIIIGAVIVLAVTLDQMRHRRQA